MHAPLAVEDKAPKPAGLLPKNIQSWLLAGLALLMILIMWLTGGKPPQPVARGALPAMASQPPLEVSESKIAEMQARIAELQREQMIAQNALAQQSRLLGAAGNTQQADRQESPGGAPAEKQEDPTLAERKKRNYLSLFASNVALSFRNVRGQREIQNTEIPPPTASPEALALAQLLKEMPPAPIPASALPAKVSAETAKDRKEENRTAAATPVGAPSVAAEKNHVLFEGTILETVLINRLAGQFPGPVECLLTTDVYSRDRQHLVIPAGTKLLGEAKRVEALGQTRLAVVFHRLLMPDGYSANLDQFQGLNQIGDAGLRDQVNNHYLRIFGASLAIGALGAVAEAGTSGSLTASGTDLMRQGFGESLAQSSTRILDRFLNVLPTITIREGHRVKVYLSGDLVLPDYSSHQMSSDL